MQEKKKERAYDEDLSFSFFLWLIHFREAICRMQIAIGFLCPYSPKVSGRTAHKLLSFGK